MGCSTSTLDDHRQHKKSFTNMEPSKQRLMLDDDHHFDGGHHKCGFCQSPIDISNNCNFGTTKVMKEKELVRNPLRFNYPSKVKNCTILNNGKTVQINIGKENNCKVSVHGKSYKLVQFHFHTPSEHLIDGKPYEMEMHLVHVNEAGQIAVLGFIFTLNPKLKEIDVNDGVQREVEDDSPNEFLNQFWDQLPFEKTTEDIPLKNPLNFQCLFEKSTTKTVDRSARSNKQEIDMEIYEYMGSLTTPPYTEGVQWLVSKKIHMFNAQQLKDLSACWNNKNNARVVQEYCGRTVLIRSSSNVLIA